MKNEHYWKRITYLIESKGLNKSQFCEKYGFAYSSFSPITNDNRTLGMNILMDLLRVFPNLNVNWLLFGFGDVNRNINDSENIINEPDESYGNDHFETLILEYLSKTSVKKRIIEIINSEKTENPLQIIEDFKIAIEVGEENSELIEKLENFIKRDITTHKLPIKNKNADNKRDEE